MRNAQMAFDDDAVPEGDPATKLKIVFSSLGKTTTFGYEEEEHMYYPSQFGERYVDGDTGEQVPFRNIIVLLPLSLRQNAATRRGAAMHTNTFSI